MDLVQKKIVQIDDDILRAADAADFKLVESKSTTKKSLKKLLTKREEAKEIHQKEKNKDLIEDAVYGAAEKAGDEETIEAMKNCTLTRKQYQELSIKYWVNTSVVEYDSEEKKSVEAISENNLLNKPNMTEKDKEWMQAAIDLLKKLNMRTEQNISMLMNNVSYGVENGNEYVQVWPHKRSKKDLKAQPNKKTIFQHGDTTYFKRSEAMIKEQNKILAGQWMGIPLDSYFEDSQKALPGNYTKWKWYDWWNILALLTDMSMSGSCDGDGGLHSKGGCGYRWSASPEANSSARTFRFNEDEGRLRRNSRNGAFPVRPVLK